MNTELLVAAATCGADQQMARELHSVLCTSQEPGAAFAAITVLRAIDLYSEADRLLKLLGTLAERKTT